MNSGSATPSPTHSSPPRSPPLRLPTPPSSSKHQHSSEASSPPQQLLQRHPSIASTAAASTETVAGSSYFTFPVTYSVNGLLRRLSGDSAPMPPSSQRGRDEGLPPLPGHLHYPEHHDGDKHKDQHGKDHGDRRTSSPHDRSATGSSYLSRSLTSSLSWGSSGGGGAGSWSAANTGATSLSSSAHVLSHKRDVARPESPFQPPPLAPLQLTGHSAGTREGAKVLSVALAEEIRLLVPARLQLEEEWRLVFSLERDGVSLATLYQKCAAVPARRGGLVLVVRDVGGGVFGAFLSDAPHPSAHYYGTGECFLWRATVLPAIPDLSELPPPPSADTTHAQRMTTLGTTPEERIRFKAFPYSGVNDYMILCEARFLSVGGGDGRYGLWLDDSLERGVSSACPTFGNEPLSDDGEKFEILGVEVWHIGT